MSLKNTFKDSCPSPPRRKYSGPLPRWTWMAYKSRRSLFRSSNNGKFPANAPLCPAERGGGGGGVRGVTLSGALRVDVCKYRPEVGKKIFGKIPPKLCRLP